MPEDSRALLGFKVWHSYGQIPGAPYDGVFDLTVDPRLGALHLDVEALHAAQSTPAARL